MTVMRAYSTAGDDYIDRINEALEERRKNPIRCEVCSERERKDVYFDYLDWFHCPRCDEHGYMSIYPDAEGKAECTGCANMQRFGSRTGY